MFDTRRKNTFRDFDTIWQRFSSFSAATRKQEVAGIRSKFPNKIPVSVRVRPRREEPSRSRRVLPVSPVFRFFTGDHRALRAGEVSAPAGQDQVPGPARAHRDPVCHHHQVQVSGFSQAQRGSTCSNGSFTRWRKESMSWMFGSKNVSKVFFWLGSLWSVLVKPWTRWILIDLTFCWVAQILSDKSVFQSRLLIQNQLSSDISIWRVHCGSGLMCPRFYWEYSDVLKLKRCCDRFSSWTIKSFWLYSTWPDAVSEGSVPPHLTDVTLTWG